MKTLNMPKPVINAAEEKLMKDLQKKYDKMLEENALIKAGKMVGGKISDAIPSKIKELGSGVVESISSAEFYKKAIEYAAMGFVELEKAAAKATVSEQKIVEKINSETIENEITSLDEICFARAYDINKMVNKYRTSNLLVATAEGAGTGALGFMGLVPNFAITTFLYFRAVQSVAIHYGYDVKNDSSEMQIASSILMNAFNPKSDVVNNELTAAIGKFMVFTETTLVRQTSNKTWTAMAERGGMGLLITQIRALSNKAAQKALTNAGKKGLEQTAFRNILEQIGKNATLKNTGKSMVGIGAFFGALFDTAQMGKIIDYANVFYGKRFMEEKEARINMIINPDEEVTIIDVEEIIEE